MVAAGLVVALVGVRRSRQAIRSVRQDGVRALTAILQQVMSADESVLLVVVQSGGGGGQEEGSR